MTFLRLKPGERVLWKGKLFDVIRRLADYRILMHEAETGLVVVFNDAELIEAYGRGDLCLHFQEIACLPLVRQRQLLLGFDGFPEKDKAEINRRLAYLQEYERERPKRMDKESLSRIVRVVAEKMGDKNPIGWTTLKGMVAYWEASDCKDPRFLLTAKHARGNRNSRYDPEVDGIIDDVIYGYYASREQPTKQAAFDRITAEIDRRNAERPVATQLGFPRRSAIYERVKKADAYAVMAGRKGKSVADQCFSIAKRGPVPSRILRKPPGNAHQAAAGSGAMLQGRSAS